MSLFRMTGHRLLNSYALEYHIREHGDSTAARLDDAVHPKTQLQMFSGQGWENINSLRHKGQRAGCSFLGNG